MAYFGTVPFGSLLAGWLSDRIGAPVTLAFGGAACVAGAIWFSTRGLDREIAAARAVSSG
jgi:MFS family permease